MKTIKVMGLAAAAMLTIPTISSAQNVAVWLDGDLSNGGNNMVEDIDVNIPGANASLVTTAQLATPGFLSGFSTLVMSRYDSSFGTYLSDPNAIANIQSYVGLSGSPGQGAVAAFTDDAGDDLEFSESGDPYVPGLNQLFINAVHAGIVSGHGFVSEYNGAAQTFAANTFGATPLDLLPGDANFPGYDSSAFIYNVGPAGVGNPIDAGVTFPLDDSETSTYMEVVTGVPAANIVDIYDGGDINGDPAIVANAVSINGGTPGVPDAGSSMLLMSLSLGGIAAVRRFVKA